MAIRTGRTYGRPNSAVGVKWYYKPSMGRMVGRIPGVARKSKFVLQINEQLRALRNSPNHPAKKCAGRSWRDFVSCLSAEMKAAIKPVKQKP